MSVLDMTEAELEFYQNISREKRFRDRMTELVTEEWNILKTQLELLLNYDFKPQHHLWSPILQKMTHPESIRAAVQQVGLLMNQRAP